MGVETHTTSHAYLGDKVAWYGEELVVSDDELLKKIDRPYLSASTAKSMQSCPARMVADRAAPGVFDLFSPTEKGSAAHLVLERLFALLPDRRDRLHASAILTEMSKSEPTSPDEVDYAKAIGADPVRYTQWVSAISRAYEGLFEIEEPKDVEVYATEMILDGVELGGVPFKGFIDRVDVEVDKKGKRGLSVKDYKTGKSKAKPNPRFGDDHGDQIRLYVAALRELLGDKPKSGFLYYVEHGDKRRVALADAEIKKTVNTFARSWTDLKNAVEERAFATRTSPLCGWCPLVNSCPAAQRESKTDRKGGAPTLVELGIPTVRADGSRVPLVSHRDRWSTVPDPEDVPAWVEHLPEVASDLRALVDEATGGHGNGPAAHTSGSGGSTAGRDLEDTMSKPWREAKPYDGPEVDGHLSLKSYASTAVFGLTELAAEQLVEAGHKVGPTTLKLVTGVLAKVVLDSQEIVTEGSRDWQEGANTRIRGALRSSLRVIPMPFGGDEAAWKRWGSRTKKFLVAIAAQALDLYDNGPTVDIAALVAAVGGVISEQRDPATERAAA